MIVAAVPVLNEETTIGSVVERVKAHVNQVLVLDDGSTDGSAAVASAAGASVIRHQTNRGKGAALQTVIAWARERTDVMTLVLLDGDGQHDPDDIPRLVTAQESAKLDILVGSRFLGANNAPLYRLFGLHVLSASASLGSGVHLTDSQSGYRVLSRRAIDELALHEDAFGVESEMQFESARAGLSMGEAPIRIGYDSPARRSPVVHGVSVLLRTIAMTARRRPLRLPLLVVTPILAIRIGRTRSV